MKIGIISDTHGDYTSGEKALLKMGNIDLLLHGGDNYKDAMELGEKNSIEVIAVKGNTDFFTSEPSEKVLNIEGKNIFLTHGHRYDVKHGLTRLYYRALELKCDVVIFGHSHIPFYLEESGIIFINPGSPSRPRGGRNPSCAVMEIQDNKIQIKIIDIV